MDKGSYKKKGIKQLGIAAESGRYLRPFAKIMLALTALREKKPNVARTQLKELVAEFPENPLFASEMAKLDQQASIASRVVRDGLAYRSPNVSTLLSPFETSGGY